MKMGSIMTSSLLLCGLLLCIVNIISVANALDNSEAKLGSIDPSQLWIQPYLIYPNDPTKMEILCETDKDVANDNEHIYIDISGADGSPVNGWTRSFETIPIYEKPDRRLWTFEIKNLNADQVYSYQIYYRDNDHSPYKHTAVYNFGMPPSPKTNPEYLEFAAFGDTRSYDQADRDHINKVSKALEQHLTKNTAFVLHVGDFVPHGGDDGGGGDTWLTDYFDTDVRDWMHRLPLFATLGNHEFEYGSIDNPLEYYNLYFPYPMYKELNSKDVSTYYYSFDWGPAHFVSFDSWSAITPDDLKAALGSVNKDTNSAQYKWLEKNLASTDRKWKIVFMHVPFYCTNDCNARDDDGRKYFQPLFERYGVNLVLAGHIHNYQRTIVNGPLI
jgi:hypothetical protein